MKNQSQLIDVELKAVYSDGIVWIIKGANLYMTDNEGTYFTPFYQGSETYLYKYKQLTQLKPLPESERIIILSKLSNNIKELM